MDKKDWEKSWKFVDILLILFKPFELLIRCLIRNGLKRLMNNTNLRNPNILELGAGTGKDSEWLIKRYGGKATLIDNCRYVISKANKRFHKKKVRINYIKSNIEDINYKNQFDLVFSIGLVEHFYNQDLINIFKKHTNASKKSGYVIIFVPHKTNIYRFFRRFLTYFNLWMWDEKPFTKQELNRLGKINNAKLITTTELLCGMWIGAKYTK